MHAFAYVVVLAMLVAGVQGQIMDEILTLPDTRCKVDSGDWKAYDKSSNYKQDAPGPVKVCARNYVNVCVGPNGLESCNKEYGHCRSVNYAWDNANMFTTFSTVRPEKCVSDGAYMAPDTKVLVIAQSIFGIIFVIAATAMCFGLRCAPCWGFPVLIAQGVMSLLLIFSYFYLNGVVQLAGTIAALALFNTRKPGLVVFGIAICLITLFWVTYSGGLGDIQHHARLTAGDATQKTFEDLCQSYYRNYWKVILPIAEHTHNPEITAYGFCKRNWLAAELFFQMFAELLLIMMAACGVQCLLADGPAKSESESAPFQ